MSDVPQINITLKADNSSGSQTLCFSYHNYEDANYFAATLCGEYEDQDIQIDFDEFSLSDLDDMIAALQLCRELYNPTPDNNTD